MPFTMERHERYDPEDIERLLQERPFDALLAEERAYVLRHLSGREEYEAMRALLSQVREDEHRRAPVQAGDEVRAQVLRAFRQEHRPQWRIWLNSLGNMLLPREGATMPLLRPALAIASLALLITVGLWVARHGGTDAAQPLAEAEAPQPKASHAPSPERPAASAPANAAAEPVRPQGAATAPAEARLEDIVRAEPVEQAHAVADGEPATTSLAQREPRDRPGTEAGPHRERAAIAATQSNAAAEGETQQVPGDAGPADAATRAGKTEARAAPPGTLAAMPQLLALMTTGW
ncbi:MAG: hypothetical protein ACK4L7_06445 [Flavobacteriales bacterium]